MDGTSYAPLIILAEDLELAGLLWRPEIGDEISERSTKDAVSILVDPCGMTPIELRATYLWLPTVEQLVEQVEAREAVLYHMGLELTDTSLCYKTVLKAKTKCIESKAETLRVSLGMALRNLLLGNNPALVQ